MANPSHDKGNSPMEDQRTHMTDEQAERWAWEQVKRDVGTEGWTAGESCTYFGFFLWGWRYKGQYLRQRATPSSPSSAPEATIQESLKVANGKPQKDAIASLHSSLRIGQRKPRPSPAAKRREIQASQMEVLDRVLKAIRQRARSTPAWANAYNSAGTVVELEILRVGKEDTAALASLPAEVDDEGLPELPKKTALGSDGNIIFRGYTAEQFRQGQRDAVAADRAKVGRAIELLREARATLETWKDVAPAVSLCADIDQALATAKQAGGLNA